MRFGSIKLALLSCLALPACVLDVADDELADEFDDESEFDDETIGESQHAGMSLNGMSLNGMSLNGMSLNGMSLNGMSLNGMSLNGMSLNGMSLNGMSLNGTQLTGKNASGATLSGTALVGAKMNATLSNGGTLVLRVDAAALLPAPNNDVWAYTVRYAQAGGVWAPLCGTASNGVPVQAVALAGTWNNGSGVTGGGSWISSATAFTFGCRGTALAKCVELGYKPWKTVNGVSLRNHHQACTRMIRADYCGDGKSWTVDGTQINVYDSMAIQADAANWPVDAEWLPTGARCIQLSRSFTTQQQKPTCFTAKAGACGNFTKGALLIDEYKP